MNETKIFGKLIEHDERLDNIESNVNSLKNDMTHVVNALDSAMVILQRLDQERIFTSEWIRRVESEVDRHTQEINHIKQQLHVT